MRLAIKGNCAGDVRLIIQSDKRVSRYVGAQAPGALVGSSKLQDDICSGHFAIKPGYGWQPDGKRFGSLAKQRLREFGALVDQQGKERTVFLTGTLPGSSPDAVKAMAAWSGWIVSRLSQWLRDRFESVEFFGVWEYQRRGALHLHCVVKLQTVEEASWLKENWKRRWVGLIDGVCVRSMQDLWQRHCGNSWSQKRWMIRTDAQSVEKSVARYLCKYLSKSSDKSRKKIALPPLTWWFASQVLRSEARTGRVAYVVNGLTLEHAHCLFESIGASLVDIGSRVFSIRNKWDARYAGLICLLPSSIAGMVLRDLSGLVKTIACGDISCAYAEAIPPRLVRAYFGGKLLTLRE